MIIAAAGVALLSAVAPQVQAQSQPQPATAGIPSSGAGNTPPGGLTPRDVVGKRLSDADGNVLGQITGVSRDGVSAEVRPAKSGGPTSVDMSELSLGFGARQVILGGEPEAPPPHFNSQSSTVTSTTSTSPVVLAPAPQ
jgi:hypothetical protein